MANEKHCSQFQGSCNLKMC